MNYLFLDKLIPQKVIKFLKGCVISQNNLCANMKNINKRQFIAKVDGGWNIYGRGDWFPPAFGRYINPTYSNITVPEYLQNFTK